MSDWQVKKEISLGDLIAIIFAISSVLLAYGKLDTRMAVVEAAATQQREIDAKQDAEAMALRKEIIQRLDRFEDWLRQVIQPRRKE